MFESAKAGKTPSTDGEIHAQEKVRGSAKGWGDDQVQVLKSSKTSRSFQA